MCSLLFYSSTRKRTQENADSSETTKKAQDLSIQPHTAKTSSYHLVLVAFSSGRGREVNTIPFSGEETSTRTRYDVRSIIV